MDTPNHRGRPLPPFYIGAIASWILRGIGGRISCARGGHELLMGGTLECGEGGEDQCHAEATEKCHCHPEETSAAVGEKERDWVYTGS